MFRSMLTTTCLTLILTSGAAMADHQGLGAVHIGTDVELGPRLSTKLETKLAQGDQQPAATTDKRDERAQASSTQAPARKVRIVYPAP